MEAIDSAPIQHEKIRAERSEIRPTYGDFFHWANESQTSCSDISVIANSDIYFDDDLLVLAQALKPGQCAALSRWNVSSTGETVLYDRNDSQDVWVFSGPLRKILGNFPVGVPRCDNRILFELKKAGYEVINPAFSVRAYHLHSGIREEYQNENLDHFVEPPYAYLWPHNLWSLPRTMIHNIGHPDARVSWRFDRRRISKSLPVRAVSKIFSGFRQKPE